MSKSINLSPKHGVNPCIPICAFCGQPKDEIVLLGKLKDDMKAPMNAIIDYEPCEECQMNWSKGIALIRVTSTPPVENMPPLTKRDGKDIYLTSQYAVITPDAAKRLFDIEAAIGTPVLIDAEVFDNFIKEANAQEGEI